MTITFIFALLACVLTIVFCVKDTIDHNRAISQKDINDEFEDDCCFDCDAEYDEETTALSPAKTLPSDKPAIILFKKS